MPSHIAAVPSIICALQRAIAGNPRPVAYVFCNGNQMATCGWIELLIVCFAAAIQILERPKAVEGKQWYDEMQNRFCGVFTIL